MLDVPRVMGNWILGEKLGSGFSGSIYYAINVHTRKVVAIKVQRTDNDCPTNRYERAIYPMLQGGEGMPTLWATGVEGRWDYLAMDLLGPSLDRLYRKNGKKVMDLRSVCCIAMQVISRLEFMHSRGVLHRDVQLGNCVLGLPPNEKKIYMIDFGFSKSYIDVHTKRHIPDSRAPRIFVGNYWFSSIGVHCRGRVPSRRDDLESTALMLIHLLTPQGLPWTRNGVPKTEEAHELLKQAKLNTRSEYLCKGLPPEFEAFLRYCRRLKFQDCPDYEMWREQFRELAVEEGFPASDAFIWPPPLVPTPSPRAVSIAKRTPVADDGQLENVLKDLANLELVDRKVLGDRKNIANAVKNEPDNRDVLKKAEPLERVIEISSGSEGSVPPPVVAPKAERLTRLTKAVSKATDNKAISQLVTEFVAVLQSNTARSLTKEGFAFLKALQKQLTDLSIFILPRRTTRTRSDDKEQLASSSKEGKLGVIARLKEEVCTARGNDELANMVGEFEGVSLMRTGRTVTKDGFAFLTGLAETLQKI